MVPAEGVGSTSEIETVSNLNKTHNYRKNELNVTLNCALIVNTDLVIYYENSSFFWTLSGVVKPFPSMGFRCRVSGVRKMFQSWVSKIFPDLDS